MIFDEKSCQRCREDFPALAREIGGQPLAHLDGPAGTQVPRPVIAAVTRYYERSNANTHGRFPTSMDTDRLLLQARESAAAFLGAASWRQISFGQNMTSLAYALSHALQQRFRPGDEIVVTQLDHEANRGPWLALRRHGIVVREVELRHDGRLDSGDMERKITHRTRLVAIGWASNALGTINDLPLARELSSAVGALLLVDAVHYAPHFPIDVTELDPDFLLCSGYKFYGPHVGVLYSREGLLEQLATDRLRTQDQQAPFRIETGTLNHAAIAGLDAAISYLASWGEGADLRSRLLAAMKAIACYEHRLARHYDETVRQVPAVTVWGPDFSHPHRAPTVSITVDGLSPGELAALLGARGLQVWDGHFYAIRPVEVLGLAATGGLLRVGISMYNTAAEVDRLVGELTRIIADSGAG